MIIDGKKIAEKIKNKISYRVSMLEHGPVVAVIAVGSDPVMEQFIAIKQKFAIETGIHMEEHRFSDTIDTDTLLAKIEDIALDDSVHGIVVQLPLPKSVDTQAVLGAIPTQKDIDVLSHESMVLFSAGTLSVLPPVVGACSIILNEARVDVKGKKAVVIGMGRLVGTPVATWLRTSGADVVSVNISEKDLFAQTSNADIIVLGAGNPDLLTPDMIKEGVIILDAGTSEVSGKLLGDASISCAEKASVFTPVPGGIGPITIALLFKNLIDLYE